MNPFGLIFYYSASHELNNAAWIWKSDINYKSPMYFVWQVLNISLHNVVYILIALTELISKSMIMRFSLNKFILRDGGGNW